MMEIRLQEVTVRELVKGYKDDDEGGVTGYGGRLDIRPPYQREFVYKDKQRDAVINTVRRGFPLNVMYWADIGGGRFEIIDGQQRTISVCQYVRGDFSIDGLAFHNLQKDQRDAILGYSLMVYVCSGSDSQKLDWFETVNIAGEELTKQELRNAVYHGPWVTDAKRHFSRPGCPAHETGSKYLKGSAIRQDFLETAIEWIHNGDINGYMSEHQHDRSAVNLWNHFRSVIDWVKATFTVYRKHMKGVDWGPLYNDYKDANLDSHEIETEVRKLMQDDDVTRKPGIYPYILTRAQKHLNIRAFSDSMKETAFERQMGVCPECDERFDFADMEGDHIDPWSEGGKTVEENCQMLCRPCNRRKGSR